MNFYDKGDHNAHPFSLHKGLRYVSLSDHSPISLGLSQKTCIPQW